MRKPYEAPREDLEKTFEEVNSSIVSVLEYFGVFYNDDGREFYNGKIDKLIGKLVIMKKLIKRQYGEGLTYKFKHEKIKEIIENRPDLRKEEVAQLVGSSIRHVERVIYGEIM